MAIACLMKRANSSCRWIRALAVRRRVRQDRREVGDAMVGEVMVESEVKALLQAASV